MSLLRSHKLRMRMALYKMIPIIKTNHKLASLSLFKENELGRRAHSSNTLSPQTITCLLHLVVHEIRRRALCCLKASSLTCRKSVARFNIMSFMSPGAVHMARWLK
jgi:hypothetical protein